MIKQLVILVVIVLFSSLGLAEESPAITGWQAFKDEQGNTILSRTDDKASPQPNSSDKVLKLNAKGNQPAMQVLSHFMQQQALQQAKKNKRQRTASGDDKQIKANKTPSKNHKPSTDKKPQNKMTVEQFRKAFQQRQLQQRRSYIKARKMLYYWAKKNKYDQARKVRFLQRSASLWQFDLYCGDESKLYFCNSVLVDTQMNRLRAAYDNPNEKRPKAKK